MLDPKTGYDPNNVARSITIGVDSTVHFDRAILEAGTVCGEPAAVVVP